jgi:hypothetical protein
VSLASFWLGLDKVLSLNTVWPLWGVDSRNSIARRGAAHRGIGARDSSEARA